MIRRRWTPARLEQLKALKADGMTTKQIARKLNVLPSSVEYGLRKARQNKVVLLPVAFKHRPATSVRVPILGKVR